MAIAIRRSTPARSMASPAMPARTQPASSPSLAELRLAGDSDVPPVPWSRVAEPTGSEDDDALGVGVEAAPLLIAQCMCVRSLGRDATYGVDVS